MKLLCAFVHKPKKATLNVVTLHVNGFIIGIDVRNFVLNSWLEYYSVTMNKKWWERVQDKVYQSGSDYNINN